MNESPMKKYTSTPKKIKVFIITSNINQIINNNMKGDRFVPSSPRNSAEIDIYHANLTKRKLDSPLSEALSQVIFGDSPSKTIDFFGKPPQFPEDALFSCPKKKRDCILGQRRIDPTPKEALDAPNIANNFYLHVLDWGSSNVLAIALGKDIYLRDMDKKVVKELPRGSNDVVSCVKFDKSAALLAAGHLDNTFQLYDVEQGKVSWAGIMPSCMISASWNGFILTQGGQDGLVSLINIYALFSLISFDDINVRNFDMRSPAPINSLRANTGYVTGISWAPNREHLASGGI